MNDYRRKERIDRGIKACTDDIYWVSSLREIGYLILPRALPVLLLVLAVLLVPLYWKKVLVITFIMAIMAISWDFLASCGLVSLGQALFFALGAYTAGAFNHYLGLPVWATIPLGTLIGGALSTVLIFPALRLRGMYFSMVTLIIPLMLMRLGDKDTVAMDILEEIGFERDSSVPLQPASVLPHGYLKRLEMARVMVLQSDLILFDELYSGLSLAEVASMTPLIERLMKEGKTIVMIEHRLKELFRLADRVMVMDQGQIIAAGTSKEIMADEDVQKAYLGVELKR